VLGSDWFKSNKRNWENKRELKSGLFAAQYSVKQQETDVFQAPGVSATDVARKKA
jgi:hypothetical protein